MNVGFSLAQLGLKTSHCTDFKILVDLVFLIPKCLFTFTIHGKMSNSHSSSTNYASFQSVLRVKAVSGSTIL